MTTDEPAPLLCMMRKWIRLSTFSILFFSCVVSCAPQGSAPHPQEDEVREFLTHYFSTWSAKDMDGYGACFQEQARIIFVHQGAPQSMGLTDFLHSQKLSHATTTVPMVEVPTDMKILRDERTAQASVRWKLTKGADTTLGTDCFTLIKTSDGWKIMSLVFYND